MTTPPPLTKPRSTSAYSITSLVIAVIGIIPLLIYLLQCLQCLARVYEANLLLVLFMAFCGFIVHAAGVILAFVGLRKGDKISATIGMIANGCLIGLVVVGAFAAIAGLS